MTALFLSRSSAIALAALALGLAGCSSSKSPPPTRIAGTVSLAGGSALDEFVALLFTPTGGGTAVSASTDTMGAYNLELTSGMYDVSATRPGYSDFAQAAVNVVANETTTFDIAMAALAANAYIGSSNCAVCHDATYETFLQTGHPFKLNKVENGMPPTYPFTSVAGLETRITDDDLPIMGGLPDPAPGTDNTLGTPTTWNAISYVIGGFNWKARFCDANGFIVTGSGVQYNFATDAFVSYHNNEVDKTFNCGNCHTTGWQHFDGTVNPNRQDGLPGMDGTFTEQGIGCESCHGSGAGHAQSKLAADITKRATPRTTADFMDGTYAHGKAVSCGECHTRDGEKDYPTYVSDFDTARTGATLPLLPEGGRIKASNGLIRHHEQLDEILGIDPATAMTTRSAAFLAATGHGDCMTCHDPHKAAVARDNPAVTQFGVDPSNAGCLSCHDSSYDPANNLRASMTNLKCTDCHMPKMIKNATSRTFNGGFLEGDIASHIFTINLSGTQFAGGFANPFVTEAFACMTCHGDEAFALSGNTAPGGFDYHPN